MDNNTKAKFYLKIAGIELSVLTDNDAEYVNKLSAELNRRVNSVMLSGNNVSAAEAALICALDLLDENVHLRLELSDRPKTTAGND